jgi:hypothetical protein
MEKIGLNLTKPVRSGRFYFWKRSKRESTLDFAHVVFQDGLRAEGPRQVEAVVDPQ